MASEPPRRPARAGSSSMRVQREDDAEDSVPLEWLDGIDRELADRLDRLAADYELVNDLALAGFKGADWDYFSTELARYGLAVMSGWMRRGLIYARCKEQNVKGMPPTLERPFEVDEIEELANETVALALVHFRDDILMKKKWDHKRGATLRTYFIGQCLIRFGGVYRTWWKKERRFADHVTDDDNFLTELGLNHDHTDRQAIAAVTAERAFASIKDPRVRFAMRKRFEGWKQSEIADVLGVTPHAVHRMIANERDRLEARKLA